MKEILLELLSRYQHLVDYGETKLSVLIAFCSAVIIGLLSIEDSLKGYWKWYFGLLIIFNVLALFFAFCGVFAKKNNKHSGDVKFEDENYYYYNYVAVLHPSQLAEGLKRDYDLESINPKLEADLCNQIVVLAKIAQRKYFYFNVALNFIIASFITPLGLLVFHIYNNPN